MVVNSVAAGLAPYPMEELARIRADLVKRGKAVYDFGTGDPRIPTWKPICEAIVKAIPEISQYPSVKGIEVLKQAQLGYLQRRFGLKPNPDWNVIPSQGSKEAIFNIALILVGRAGGKRRIIYPDPGYPVYKSSTLFAGGIPHPVRLRAEDDYKLKPWTLPRDVQTSAAAIWVNHPHNPTGAMADRAYFEELIDWAHRTDTILLSDDCYVDIYDIDLDNKYNANPNNDLRPICPLSISSDRVLTFMSLSKRSGLTGYRAGLVAGDARIIDSFLKARANFGVGSPDFIQHGAVVAWNDDQHVEERRKIFTHRINLVAPTFQNLGLIKSAPQAAFYLWCEIPQKFGDDDVKFCLSLAEQGIITSPSQWLSEGMRGYVRFALVPEDKPTLEAMEILKKFLN